MKILLLQDEIYLPSLGGGTKANRLLLESLAREGHECGVISPALTRSPDGPKKASEFREEMAERRIELRADGPEVFRYEHRGVEVDAMNLPDENAIGVHVRRRIEQFRPDWVIVGDDRQRCLLESALRAARDRVVMVLQTIVQLPFGPLAVNENRKQAELMREAKGIFVISEFQRGYIRTHSGLEARIIRLPVYGDGPFPMLARFDRGFVTMINPCDLKGAPIFIELARKFAEFEFAAVPTWGANESTLRILRQLPNVRLLKPADDIEDILRQTRIMLMPSLWPETFGYVVPEAMLRGIPVLASNIGGLPEAKLGVDYLLPVTPAQRRDGAYVAPPQDVGPWGDALSALLGDARTYERVSRESREAATKHVSAIKISAITESFASL
jgi:glycosyltransferase involved in cell wall biosynthesis